MHARAEADPEPLIREHLRWPAEKAPLPFRKPAPLRLQARLAAIRGERERAAQRLEQSLRANAEIGSLDEVERDRYALGLLTGADPGPAIAALRSMGIQDPEREIRGYYPELARDN